MFGRQPKWKRQAEARLQLFLDLLANEKQLGTEQVAYLKERWQRPTLNMLASAVPAGTAFRVLRMMALIGSLSVPILASFNAADTNPARGLRYATLAASLLVAGATAMQQAFGYRQNWQLNWHTASALEAEAWSYAVAVSPEYSGPGSHFGVFVTRIESLITEWSRRSLVLEDEPHRDGAAASGTKPDSA